MSYHEWDDSIKRLFREHPQDFVSWLVPGAIYLEPVASELKNRTRQADILLAIQKQDKISLLEVEVQSTHDPDILDRLLEYNVLTTVTYRRPVISCLLLLRPQADVAASPLIKAAFDEIEVWRFHYAVIKLWEVPAEELAHSGLIGTLPLAPLTKGGLEPEMLTKVARELFGASEYELLSLTKVLTGLMMKHASQQEMLERVFAMYRDIIEESWVYQDIKRKGLAEGLEKGLTQGLERGLSRGLERGLTQGLERGLTQGLERGQSLGEKRALLAIIQRRFPEILGTADKMISVSMDAGTLENLVADVSVAQSAQEVLQLLNALDPRKQGSLDDTQAI